jgi:hypothetical protein
MPVDSLAEDLALSTIGLPCRWGISASAAECLARGN